MPLSLMQSVEEIWEKFREQFSDLWDSAVASGKAGDLNHAGLYSPFAESGSDTLRVIAF